MTEIIEKNENELIIKLAPNEIDNILRKRIRAFKDAKLMSEQNLKMLSCYKKDGIELNYKLDNEGYLIINLIDTTFGNIREVFKMEKEIG